MNKNKKSDNRRALPKFLITLLLSVLCGTVTGGLVLFLRNTLTADQIAGSIHRGLAAFLPYSFWLVILLLGGASLLLYRQAKSLFTAWDGESEEPIEKAEEKLSWMILLTSLAMILSFFFFGCLSLLEYAEASSLLLTFAGFLASLVTVVLLQQKAVDLTKKINPEKKGSIYDNKFHDKWLDSCDENEKRQIGQASAKSYKAVTTTCVVLFLLLFLLGNLMDIGILPIFLVTLILGVSQVTYCLEAIRLGRGKA